MTFIRYVAIQLVAYAIDMGLFLFFLYAGFFGPITSNILCKIIAGTFAFTAHQRFTFRLNEENRNNNQTFRYFILLAANVPISATFLSFNLIFIDWPALAKLIADIASVLITFWISKHWVFSTKTEKNASQNNNKI